MSERRAVGEGRAAASEALLPPPGFFWGGLPPEMRGIVLRGGSLPRPGFWGHFFFNFYFFRIFFFSIPSLGGEAVFGLGGAPLPDGRIRRARGLWGWGGGRGAPPPTPRRAFLGAPPAAGRPGVGGGRGGRAGGRACAPKMPAAVGHGGGAFVTPPGGAAPSQDGSAEKMWRREKCEDKGGRKRARRSAAPAGTPPGRTAPPGPAPPPVAAAAPPSSRYIMVPARPPARAERSLGPGRWCLRRWSGSRRGARGGPDAGGAGGVFGGSAPVGPRPPPEKGGGRSPCCGPRRALTVRPPALLPLGRPVPQNVPLVHFQVWCAPVWRKQGRAAVWKEIWKPWGEAGEKEVEPG